MALKLSPIHEIARRAGATMAEEAGWVMAQSYKGGQPGSLRVGLIDQSGFGKIMIHGRAGGRAAAVLGIESPEAIGIGQGVFAGDTAVYRLRADQLFISTPPGGETVALAALAAADTGGERVTITDVTHGRAQLRLIGPASAELLGRLCGLDLRPDHFPDRAARQTGVAKTTQLIIRHDLDDGRLLSYSLIGARSLGAYLWETILDSGSDLGIRPLGANDLMIP